ncbi:MAG: hypothetical protein DMG26_10600 [Acidobacteria bacterium]|nr:MAG: hypothetical protein DMG26_10600 [Acidobacteriota bacterium]
MAENGVPLKTLQEQMGHPSIATTMKYYVHAQEKSSREAARVIGRAMGPTGEKRGGRTEFGKF